MRNKRIKKILTKNFLIEEYINKQKSANIIGFENNICKRTILDYLIKFDIIRRKCGVKKGSKRTIKSRLKQSKTLKENPHLWKYKFFQLPGKLNNNYKHGNYCKEHYCIKPNCSKKVSGPNKKCNSCAQKIAAKKKI